jgi:hypothetical protein
MQYHAVLDRLQPSLLNSSDSNISLALGLSLQSTTNIDLKKSLTTTGTYILPNSSSNDRISK